MILDPPVTASSQRPWSGLPVRYTKGMLFAVLSCAMIWAISLHWGPHNYLIPITHNGSSASDTRPVAVIIETAMPPNIIPLILHFASVLGPAWRVIFYTLEENWSPPASPVFQRAMAGDQVDVRFLPPDTQLNSTSLVSKFLASPWIWEQFESAKSVLLFQADSIICSKSELTVDDFFEYDFIGAPIAEKYGEGYNGGLSLRNPRLFLDITRSANFTTSKEDYEDRWFYKQIKARIEKGEDARMPRYDIAQKFSVETIYYDQPLGYHQPKRWQAAKMGEISEWCPEVGLLAGRRVKFG